MSIERELLKEVLEYFDPLGLNTEHCGDLPERIKELLAQPEQEQEPVGIVRTIGGYPDNSEHVVDWLCKYKDLKEGDRLYLAPPIPKTTAEPVAWMVETHFNNEPIKEIHTVKPMERVYKYCIVTELYAAPLKPLTGKEISNGFKADDEATHPYSYWAGVDFAEKYYGIGGGE